jgi:hypothetical protein
MEDSYCTSTRKSYVRDKFLSGNNASKGWKPHGRAQIFKLSPNTIARVFVFAVEIETDRRSRGYVW